MEVKEIKKKKYQDKEIKEKKGKKKEITVIFKNDIGEARIKVPIVLGKD